MDAGAFQFGWLHAGALAAGYLLGSIPFGLLLARLTGHGDIRRIGSGNIGATNVLRTGNKALAAATLLLDGGKGALAVLALSPWGVEASLLAGFAAVAGHNFPVWLKLRGGKGVATTLGTVLAAAWPVGVASALVWLAVAVLLRYSSLAALVALIAAPFFAFWLASGPVVGFTAALALLGVVRHRDNIRRLLKGEEPKIGKKTPPAA